MSQNTFERYETLNLLGRGAMGEVWRVRDRETGEILALKCCLADGPAERMCFRQESGFLTRLKHEGLLHACAVGEGENGAPFCVMPVVEGINLPPHQGESQVRRWLPRLLAALAYLHGRGLVHADLKPENVRLLPDGEVMIMDFGLMRPAGPVKGIRGTPAYMAPEVALGRPTDGRADLYALGCVLYYALAGEPPFTGDDANALLRAHVEKPAPDLAGRVPGLSPAMAKVVQRLLAKTPETRYASAVEVLKALNLPRPDGDRITWVEPPLTGQADVQAALKAFWADAVEAPRGVCLHGAGGSGKTRWSTEAAAEGHRQGWSVFSVRGSGPEASPYQAVESLLASLMVQASEEARARNQAYVARAIPGCEIPAAAPLDGTAEKVRFHDAVANLAESLAGCVLWVLDAPERLDPDSLALLEFLKRRGSGRQWRWVECRGDAEGVPADWQTLGLTPLTAEEAASLVEGALCGDCLPADVQALLFRIGRGNPGALLATLRHWIDNGALARIGDGLEVPLAEKLVAPPSGAEALTASLRCLSESARRLCLWAALAGVEGTLATIAELADVPQNEALAGASELQRSGLWFLDGNHWTFARPEVVPSLRGLMPDAERKAAHGRLAQACLAGRDPATIATSRALGDWRRVAEHLLGAEAWEQAWTIADPTIQRGLLTGQYRLVLPLIEAWLQAGDKNLTRLVMVRSYHAQGLRRLGRIDEALAFYDTPDLETLREVAPNHHADHLVTHGLLMVTKGRYAEARPRLQEGAQLAESLGLWPAVVRAQFTEGRVHYFQGQSVTALQCLRQAEATANTHALEAMLPPILSLQGLIESLQSPELQRQGTAKLLAAAEQARALGNLYDEADALGNLGNTWMMMGHYAAARDTFTDYLALCERQAEVTETIFAELNLGTVLLHQGDWLAARQHAERALQLSQAQKRKFPEAYTLALSGLLQVFSENPAEGLDRLQRAQEIAAEINNSQLDHELQALWGTACLAIGDQAGAAAALAAAGGIVGENQGNRLLQYLHWQLQAQSDPASVLSQDASNLFPDRADLRAALTLAQAAAARQMGDQTSVPARLEASREAALEAGLALEGLAVEVLLAGWSGQAGRPVDTVASAAEEAGHPQLAALARLQSGDRLIAQQGRRWLEAWRDELPEHLRAAASAAWGNARGPVSTSRMDNSEEVSPALLLRVSTQSDFETVKREVAAVAGEFFDAEEAYLLLFEDFEVRQTARWKSPDIRPDSGITNFAYDVIWGGAPCVEEFEGADSHHRLAGLPLFEGLHVFGAVVVLLSPAAFAQWTQRQAGAAPLMQQAAWSLLHTQQFGAEQHARAVASDLVELGIQVLTSASLADRWQLLARAGLAWSRADRILWVRRGTSGELDCAAAAWEEGDIPSPTDEPFSRSISNWAVERNEPVFLLDAQGEDAVKGQLSVMALGLRSVFALPVEVRGEVVGVLYMDLQHIDTEGAQALPRLAGLARLWGACLQVQEQGAPA
ncbi:MAG: AAA family ATPase [Candidatus Sericytochromatia bacterium]|nr:AAA family ATPase [Candidatus Sericytochromatia bacterium]